MLALEINYYNIKICVLLFLAVKSGSEVDLAPGIERRDNAVRKRPTVERTCKCNIICVYVLEPQSTVKQVNYCCVNWSV